MRSSNASAPCRFELRPSRWLIGAMLLLALLCPWAVLSSEMPGPVAWPLAILAGIGALLIARREARRPTVAIVLHPGVGAQVDGRDVEAFEIDWRGPLAFLAWTDADGHRRRGSVWPDTLSPALRRELRLASAALTAVRGRDTMAP